jgi:hypothetical protein
LKGAPASRAGASIAWALAADGPYTTVWEYAPPAGWLDGKPQDRLLVWPEVDRRVEGIPAGTRKVFVRYRLDGMALDDIRLSSFTRPEAGPAARLEIKHEWLSGGMRMSKTIEIADPSTGSSYNLDAGTGEMKNKTIILECQAQ